MGRDKVIKLSVQMHMKNSYKENSKKLKQQPTCGIFKIPSCTSCVCCCLDTHAYRHILIAENINILVRFSSPCHGDEYVCLYLFACLCGVKSLTLPLLIIIIYTLKGFRNMWMPGRICREMVHLFPYLCFLLFFPSSFGRLEEKNSNSEPEGWGRGHDVL